MKNHGYAKKISLLIGCLLASSVAAVSLAGCGSDAPAPETSAEAVSSTASYETPRADEGPSSSPEADASEAVSDSGFEAYFAENPLDADYEIQMGTAYNTQEIVSVANTYAGLWRSEISHAYARLLEEADDDSAAEIEADQESWNNHLESALDQISQSIGGDGSAIQAERAVRVKEFYREKAKELYEKLYQLDPDYTYQYMPY